MFKKTNTAAFSLLFCIVLISIVSLNTTNASANVASRVLASQEPPGQLILDEVAVFDDNWRDANPDGGYYHYVVPLPGPGVPVVTGYSDRTGPGCEGYPDPCYCDSGGGYDSWVLDENDQELPYYGDNWVQGGRLVVDAFPCISSLGDVYDYKTVIKAYFDPDPDADKVPDSRDKCPDTPAGAEVDEDGCSAADLEPPTLAPMTHTIQPTLDKTPTPGFCQVQVTPSEVYSMPGVGIDFNGTALKGNNPMSNALVEVTLGGLEGEGYAAPSRTDSQGNFQFTYFVPNDVGGRTSVILSVKVDNCPAVPIKVIFGPTPTHTLTPSSTPTINNVVPVTSTYTPPPDNTPTPTKTKENCGDGNCSQLEEDCVQCPEDCTCQGCEICDPFSILAHPWTKCSPPKAYIFINKDFGWREQVMVKVQWVNISKFFRSKGYYVEVVYYSKNSAGRDKVIDALTNPSTKAIAHFAHEKYPAIADMGANDIQNALFPAAYKKWSSLLPNDQAKEIANAKAKSPNLDYVYNHSCHSLDDKSLANYLLIGGGKYWGDEGILTGLFGLEEYQKPQQ